MASTAAWNVTSLDSDLYAVYNDFRWRTNSLILSKMYLIGVNQ